VLHSNQCLDTEINYYRPATNNVLLVKRQTNANDSFMLLSDHRLNRTGGLERKSLVLSSAYVAMRRYSHRLECLSL